MGEAGFTMIELIMVIVLVSILGTFIFGVLTKSLDAQIAMQTRKERADDAILVLEKIGREVREAESIITASSNNLTFKRADTGKVVRFKRANTTSPVSLIRKSATTETGLSSASGNIVAENVTVFDASTTSSYGGNTNLIDIDLEFDKGSHWTTKIQPRNIGL